MIWVNQIVQGVMLGGYYALIAPVIAVYELPLPKNLPVSRARF